MAKQREMEKKKKKIDKWRKTRRTKCKNNVNYFTKTFKSSKFYGVDDPVKDRYIRNAYLSGEKIQFSNFLSSNKMVDNIIRSNNRYTNISNKDKSFIIEKYLFTGIKDEKILKSLLNKRRSKKKLTQEEQQKRIEGEKQKVQDAYERNYNSKGKRRTISNKKTNLMTKYGFTNNNLSTSKLNVSNITRIQKLNTNGVSKNKIKIAIKISSSPEDSRIKLRDLQIEQLKKQKYLK